ncbi:MarR family winged helix-turn-helix transcriptional regulator [Sphingosinicella sp. CPCC 101087]|uniref:MarR family winged helix-turn-helix transcriptional regulator n=1 Tax=Sphingosinicella sp. CPCC 101087 TaxID=2497754 RepID=UPI0013EB8DE8|nr:MarR family winged helix-turn-helix transcriptional regulator [Sphingosinicella sp. CPCC 101087]
MTGVPAQRGTPEEGIDAMASESAQRAKADGVVRPAPRSAAAGGRPEQPRFGALDDILGLHVSLGNMAIVQHFKQTLEPLKLTQKQTAVLWLASDNPGVVQIELAALLRVDRATMLGITNNLARRGLIERRPVAYHGRRRGLHLTEKGAALLAEAQVAVRTHEKWVKGHFSAQERALIVKLMKRLYADAPPFKGDDSEI